MNISNRLLDLAQTNCPQSSVDLFVANKSANWVLDILIRRAYSSGPPLLTGPPVSLMSVMILTIAWQCWPTRVWGLMITVHDNYAEIRHLQPMNWKHTVNSLIDLGLRRPTVVMINCQVLNKLTKYNRWASVKSPTRLHWVPGYSIQTTAGKNNQRSRPM